MKKKGFTLVELLAVISIMLVIIIITVPKVLNIMTSSKERSYNDLEDAIVLAAKTYASSQGLTNLGLKETGDFVYIPLRYLTKAGLLDGPVIDPRDGVAINNKTRIKLSIEAGNIFTVAVTDDTTDIITLKDKVISYGTVTTGMGLYFQNGYYLFKGGRSITRTGVGAFTVNTTTEPANYVLFDGKSWRIMKMDNIGIKLALDFTNTASVNQLSQVAWDAGNVNDYLGTLANSNIVSDIKSNLDTYYNSLSSAEKSLLAYFDLCIEKTSTPAVPACQVEGMTAPNQKVGLLEYYEFTRASTATNEYDGNFLFKENTYFWTINASDTNHTQVYSIGTEGYSNVLRNTNESTTAYNRPVIYLKNTALYSSGDGTKTRPFVVEAN